MDAEIQNPKLAVLWQPLENEKVQCSLCNHRCIISSGKVGRCAVRKNIDGTLYSLNYDKVCAANVDPIEKKPLYHFQPSSKSFSIAAPGCNFRCDFCQNWQISQQALEDGYIEGQAFSPQEIVDGAVRTGCRSISYTYTEPTVFMELCAETAILAKEKGLSNVFVSNGFMTIEAVDFVKDWLDAINIDLKAFSEGYYKNLCKAHLQPVLETIKYIARQTKIWLELTTLIVPGENDSEDEFKAIAHFIAEELNPYVPWHISRFYPQYKFDDKTPTPLKTLELAYNCGEAAGLKYVYLGNVPGAKLESTYCHNCGKLLIERHGFDVTQYHIHSSSCSKCGTQIPGSGL
jgi:pyruvate formate lyase activating enzyme